MLLFLLTLLMKVFRRGLFIPHFLVVISFCKYLNMSSVEIYKAIKDSSNLLSIILFL